MSFNHLLYGVGILSSSWLSCRKEITMTMQEQIDAAFTEGLSDYLAKEAEEDERRADESDSEASV